VKPKDSLPLNTSDFPAVTCFLWKRPVCVTRLAGKLLFMQMLSFFFQFQSDRHSSLRELRQTIRQATDSDWGDMRLRSGMRAVSERAFPYKHVQDPDKLLVTAPCRWTLSEHRIFLFPPRCPRLPSLISVWTAAIGSSHHCNFWFSFTSLFFFPFLSSYRQDRISRSNWIRKHYQFTVQHVTEIVCLKILLKSLDKHDSLFSLEIFTDW